MKAHIIISFILLSQSLVINAQYFALAKSKEYFYSRVLQYPQDGKYRVLMYNKAYDWNSILLDQKPPPHILVYNSNFQLVDSIALPKNIGTFHHGQPVKDGARLLWPCLSSDTLPNSPYRTSILELDTLCHPVNTHVIQTLYGADFNVLGMVVFPNHYVMATNILDSIPFHYLAQRFYKLDKNFNKLDSLDIDTTMAAYIDYSACFESNVAYGNKMVLRTRMDSLPCMPSPPFINAAQILTMDTAIQISNCMLISSLPPDTCNGIPISETIFEGHPGVLALSSTKFFVYGYYEQLCGISPFTTQTSIIDLIIDNNQQLVKMNKFSATPANVAYRGATGDTYAQQYNYPIAVKHPYLITVASIGFNEQTDPTYYNMFPPFWPYFSNQKTKMLVTKMDTMGTVIWSKTYGGEMSYFPNSVAFTKDGGCVIAGTRHSDDDLLEYNIAENFLLKLDSMGNYPGMDVGINESKDEGLRPRVYPNPANIEIYFDVPNEQEVDIEIYNTLGQLLLSKSKYTNRSAINISSLNKDLYFYKIKTQKNNYTGKFVKD